MKLIQTAQALREAVAAGAEPTSPCHCAMGACAGWTSVTEERWPAAHMVQVATLRDPEAHEPTFEEWHPAGTRYDSPQAPIAPRFFPCNRSDLWQCSRCHRHALRYTEFGGYYVDHRARLLDPDLIDEGPASPMAR